MELCYPNVALWVFPDEAGLDDLMSVRPNTGEDIEDVTAEGLMAVVNGTQKLF